MLQYLTGGCLRSAVHRIDTPDTPTNRNRYSSPLFIYLRADVRSITAAECFESRVRAIGLSGATIT